MSTTRKTVPKITAQIAFTTDPLTRPADVAYTTIPLKIRSIQTKRGVRILTGEIETGTVSAEVDDPLRKLDPSNASSPYAPNVKARRRIRFIVDPDGSGAADAPIYTGFIDGLPLGWRRKMTWVRLTAADLLWILASIDLPPSVLHVETLASAPLHYWPLTETVGRVVEDAVGTWDGNLRRPIGGSEAIVPYDPRPVVHFNGAENNDPIDQRATMRSIQTAGVADITFAVWFQQTGDQLNSALMMLRNPTVNGCFVAIGCVSGAEDTIYVSLNGLSFGTGIAEINAASPASILDGKPHRLVVTLDNTSNAVDIWLDGELQEISGSSPSTDISTVDITDITANSTQFEVGWGFGPGGSSIKSTGLVGHATFWDRVLTAAEITADFAAGTNPWAGDTTGARLARVLDIGGVDPADRDLDAGSQICSATLLDGQNLMAYIRKIVATEGGSLFVDPDGKVAFRAAPVNDPSPVVVFSDNPTGDSGVPYAPIEPGYSLDRVVNIAKVTRENGIAQTSTNDDSVGEYGPRSIPLDTLHQTPSGARGRGGSIVARQKDPRLVFERVKVDDVDDTTHASGMQLTTEIGDAATVIARPPSGSAISQLSIVQRVEHHLDGKGRWTTDFGIVEHTVLDEFEWDGADGTGWDESVWTP